MASDVKGLLQEIEASCFDAKQVTRLLEEVEASYLQAQYELSSATTVVQHAIISKQMDNIVRIHGELQTFLGGKALRLVLQTMKLAETKWELQQQKIEHQGGK